jgi:hypothetical protein
MKTILRRENVWDLTKNHVQPTKFPTTMLGTKYIEKNTRKEPCSIWYTIIINNLLSFVSMFANPALAWNALHIISLHWEINHIYSCS